MSSEPEDPVDDWGIESEALLRATRSDHAPNLADRQRVRRALAQRIASAAEVTASAPARQPGSALARVAQFGVGLALVVAGTYAVMRANDARVAQQPPSVEPSALAGSASDMPSLAAAKRQSRPLATKTAPSTRPLVATRAHGDAGDEDMRAHSAARAEMRSQAAARGAGRQVRTRVPAAANAARKMHVLTPASKPLDLRAAVSVKTRTSSAAIGRVESPPSSATGPTSASVGESTQTSVAATRQPGSSPGPTPQSASDHAARAFELDEPPSTPQLYADRRTTTVPAPSIPGPREELRFIRKIQAALVTEKQQEVLGLCAQHEQRWPDGTFVQEREGLRSIALCNTAAPDASERARRFLSRYPRTPLGARVREACKL